MEQPQPSRIEQWFLNPENKARILRWAWLISLFMLVMGYLIIAFELDLV